MRCLLLLSMRRCRRRRPQPAGSAGCFWCMITKRLSFTRSSHQTNFPNFPASFRVTHRSLHTPIQTKDIVQTCCLYAGSGLSGLNLGLPEAWELQGLNSFFCLMTVFVRTEIWCCYRCPSLGSQPQVPHFAPAPMLPSLSTCFLLLLSTLTGIFPASHVPLSSYCCLLPSSGVCQLPQFPVGYPSPVYQSSWKSSRIFLLLFPPSLWGTSHLKFGTSNLYLAQIFLYTILTSWFWHSMSLFMPASYTLLLRYVLDCLRGTFAWPASGVLCGGLEPGLYCSCA